MSEAPSWQHMWGATVRMPCDMEDDILEDVIQVVTRRLKEFDADGWEKCGSTVCEEIKAHLDTTWEAYWLVCIGRNFGSYVTHVTRNFVFFYYNEKAIMVYKAG
ncbi:hypothetical protein ABG067_006084 [Albugo candida]|uniref:Dynein light chain n=2 Tax=Albugo candida TaxID=65357 RepID=A0A024GQ62_9STRA|nr:unnamed protein product [Albugo candida]|eukprot:CCI48480.1 unnamed protein product [Albugo candida]